MEMGFRLYVHNRSLQGWLACSVLHLQVLLPLTNLRHPFFFPHCSLLGQLVYFRLENSQEGTRKTPGRDFNASRHFAKQASYLLFWAHYLCFLLCCYNSVTGTFPSGWEGGHYGAAGDSN